MFRVARCDPMGQYFFSLEGLRSPLVDEERETLPDDAAAVRQAHRTARELARNSGNDFHGLKIVVRGEDGLIVGAAQVCTHSINAPHFK